MFYVRAVRRTLILTEFISQVLTESLFSEQSSPSDRKNSESNLSTDSILAAELASTVSPLDLTTHHKDHHAHSSTQPRKPSDEDEELISVVDEDEVEHPPNSTNKSEDENLLENGSEAIPSNDDSNERESKSSLGRNPSSQPSFYFR